MPRIAVRNLLIAFTFAIFGGLAAGTGAMAQNQELAPEHIAIARKFVDISDSVKLYELALLQAGVQTSKMLSRRDPTMDQDMHDSINNAIGRTIAGYSDQKDELMDQIARVYAQRFTPDELQKMIDFYSTDVGQKYVKQSQAISKELKSVMQVFGRNLQTEFFARVKADLKEHGVDI